MRPSWKPVDEIQFAARSGFLTKSLWIRHFAGESHESWINKRWRLLSAGDFFIKHPSSFDDVLVPNPKSPLVQRLIPGGVFRPPYAAQLRHDEIMYDGFLTLKAQGLVRDFVTEGGPLFKEGLNRQLRN
jgi:hypothetical protein